MRLYLSGAVLAACAAASSYQATYKPTFTRMNSAATMPYENPSPGGCLAGEVIAQLSGINGQFCSPACSATVACPKNPYPYQPYQEPAIAQCALQYPNQTAPTGCALQCDPAGYGPCPPGAGCQPFSGVGFCVYPLPQTEAASLHPTGALATATARTRDLSPLAITVCAAGDCGVEAVVTLAALPWTARDALVAITSAATTVPGNTGSIDLDLDLDARAGSLRIDVAGARAPLALTVQLPRDVLAATTAASARGALSVRLAGCSDGADNNGNALADYPLDAACAGPWDEEEAKGGTSSGAATPVAAPAGMLSWVVTPHSGDGTGNNGAFIASLSWTPPAGGAAVPVWVDEAAAGLPNPARWFTHDSPPGSGSALALVNFSATGDGQPGVARVLQSGAPAKVLLSANATHAEVLYTYEGVAITVVDVMQLSLNTLFITTTVTSEYVDAADTFQVGIPFNFGSLQLGRRVAGSGALNLANSGLWRFDSKRAGSLYMGGAPYCGWNVSDIETDGYPTFGGFYSPVAGFGDAKFSFGVSTMDAAMSPDFGHNFSVNYIQKLAAPRSPAHLQWNTVTLAPGASHTFVVAVAVGPPAEVGLIDCAAPPPAQPLPPGKRDVATLMAVYQPYFTWFYAVHGSTPTYCPTPASFWRMGSDSEFNRSNNRFNPGAKIADVMQTGYLAGAKGTGIPNLGMWTSGLYSSYMTTTGEAFEFNPVTEVFDPNMDAGCNNGAVNAAIKNLTEVSSVKQAFWFHRPCSDIVVPGTEVSPAFTSCAPNGPLQITKGAIVGNPATKTGWPVSLADNTSAYVQRNYARAAKMISMGINGFYMDSHFCPGNQMYIRNMYAQVKADLWILPEGAMDTRALISHQLPWGYIGSWNPAMSDDIGLLVQEFLPLTGNLHGELGPGPTDDDIMALAYMSRGMEGLFMAGASRYSNTTECGWIHQLYSNYQARMTAYGTKLGCPLYPAPTPTCA